MKSKEYWTSRAGGSAIVLALGVMLLTVGDNPASAQDSFYAGKRLTIVARSAAGGGYDTYARLVGRYIGRYIPGSPNVIVTNRPGGNGLVTSNHIANRAPRDGTEIGAMSRDLALVQRIGAKGVLYDARNLRAIGNAESETRIWAVRADHPVSKLTDLKTYKDKIFFSASGGDDGGGARAILLLKAAGFPVEVVSGYSGLPERLLAIERRELDGTSGGYGGVTAAVKEGRLKIIGRMGTHPELTKVEDARDVMSSALRPLAAMIGNPEEIGRPFYAPPDVPMDRIQILRGAFKQALQDSELIEEARRAKRDVQWMSGEDVDKLNEEILSTPDDVVAKFNAM